MERYFIKQLLFALLILILAIILGAFGAHALEPHFEEGKQAIYKTASQYHYYGAIMLFIIAGITYKYDLGNLPYVLCVFGISFFSGSLYLLSFSSTLPSLLRSIIGPITPIGGLLMIISLSVLFFRLRRILKTQV